MAVTVLCCLKTGMRNFLRSSNCSGLAATVNTVPKYLSKVFTAFVLLTQHKNVCYCTVTGPQSTHVCCCTVTGPQSTHVFVTAKLLGSNQSTCLLLHSYWAPIEAHVCYCTVTGPRSKHMYVTAQLLGPNQSTCLLLRSYWAPIKAHVCYCTFTGPQSKHVFVTAQLLGPNQHPTALSVSKLGLQVVSAPSGNGVYAMKDGNGGLTGNPVGFIRDRTGFKQTGD